MADVRPMAEATDAPGGNRVGIVVAGLVAGLGAALVMVGVSLAVRTVTGVPTQTEVLADGFTAFVPLGLFAAIMAVLETYAKRMLFLGIAALQLTAGGLIGLGAAAWLGRRAARGDGVPWPGGLLVGLGAWLAVMLVVMPLFGAGVFAQHLRAGSYIAAVSLLDWLVFGLSLVWLAYQLAPRPRLVDDLGTPVAEGISPARRRLMVGGGLAALAAVMGGLGLRSLLTAPTFPTARAEPVPPPAPPPAPPAATAEPTAVAAVPAPPAVPAAAAPTAVAAALPAPATPVAPPEASASEVPGMTLAITPNKDFYTVSKNFLDPTVDVANWKLEVTGLVERPLTFTYDEFVRLPSREQFTTLECISNEVGGDLMGNALWRGVPLKHVLDLARPRPGVEKVVFRAWDDYSDSFPFDVAMREANLIAYEMNGATLPPDHGFPLRLLVPGIFGMKNVKWITKIELVDHDYKGFWQQRGWSDEAPVLTMSRIDVPIRSAVAEGEARYLAGVAFSGDRGIQKVEVSLDRGATWHEAQLKQPLGPYTWVLWVYAWNAEPGQHTATVRATDGTGELQTEQEQPPIPDGATGWHLRRYRVG